MKALFDQVSDRCSTITTRVYSTSFSLGIRLLEKPLRKPLCAIYSFVRFADEIVDTFHDYDKNALLTKFEADTYQAIRDGISLNPILNSFQSVVNHYRIDHRLIDTFLQSMRMDLQKQQYNQTSFEQYILGSAKVVGLMCLKVFCEGDEQAHAELKPYAMSLGSAFQKVNFLRDLHADFKGLGRSYFPEIDLRQFDKAKKSAIEASIAEDFADGLIGIMKLSRSAKFGVYVAYVYYHALFKKIKRVEPAYLINTRIRIPNSQKYAMMLSSYIRYKMNLYN